MNIKMDLWMICGSSRCDLWIDRVIKLDCFGHVQKGLGKALYEFQRTSLKLEDSKPVKGRQGRLTKTAIEKMKRSYGKLRRGARCCFSGCAD